MSGPATVATAPSDETTSDGTPADRRGWARLPGGASRWRITVAAVVASAVLLCAAGVLAYQLLLAQQAESSQQTAVAQLATMVGQLRSGSLPGSGQTSYFEVSTPTQTLAASDALRSAERSGPLSPALSGTPMPLSGAPGALPFGTATVAIDGPANGADDPGPTVTIVYTDIDAGVPAALDPTGAPVRASVVVPTDLASAVTGTTRTALLVGVPLVVLVVGVVVWLAVGRALAPVEAIRRRMSDVTAGPADARVPVPPTGDEVQRLAMAVNAALDRLAQADRRQREFIADASHELRSPVAALRSTIDVARLYPGSVPVADTLDAAHRQLGRLSRLADDLLLLESLEQPVAAAPTVDAREPIRAEIAARVGAGGVPITVELPFGPVPVRMAPTELGRAVGNLLSNATRHARTQVWVTLHRGSADVTITVCDDGAGIAADDRERVFARLVRLDPARAADAGGAGLGLAITRRLVERAGGSVVADERQGRTAFVITLPAAGAAADADAGPDGPANRRNRA